MQICTSHRSARLARFRMPALALGAALAAVGALSAGCGGGGGGVPGGMPVAVKGRVIRAETGLAPNPAAMVAIGSSTATAGVDGVFTFNAASDAKTATITAQGSKTRTIAVALSVTQPNNLGDVYISDTGYNADVTGRVVALVGGNTQPVGNATVTLANVTTTTKTDGTFALTGLPVDLGNDGNAGRANR